MISVEVVIIVLFSLSILLFILSFFKKDNYKELENQVESLTMMVMQENYQLKKKMKVLEEELLVNDSYTIPINERQDDNL